MTIFWRKLTFLSLIVFAISFFLPPGFYNSPIGRFKWSLDTVSEAESFGESLAWIGICLVIIYPYIWALISALFFLGGSSGRWAIRSQFICHLIGGIPVMALALALILLKAEFPSVPVQWVALLVPAILLAVLLIIAFSLRSSRRFPAMAALALMIFAPIQFLLYHGVSLDGGTGWGYLLGGMGAMIGFIGCLIYLFRL